MSVDDGGIDDDFMATMLGDFLDESQGYLSNLNDNLLALDKLVSEAADGTPGGIDAELLNEMFRDAHSLKGLSAMLQLPNINSLTHRIENVFDAARNAKLTITRNTVDLMFQALDRLTGMVDQLRDESDETVEYQSVVEEIQKTLDDASGDHESSTAEGDSDAVGDSAERNLADGETASDPTAPEPTETDSAEPELTAPKPASVEPESTETESAEPELTAPKPASADLESSEPASAEPELATPEPASVEPESTETESAEPEWATPEPASAETESSETDLSEPEAGGLESEPVGSASARESAGSQGLDAGVGAMTEDDSTPNEITPNEITRDEITRDIASIEDEPEIPEKYLSIFVDEALEALDSINDALAGDEPVRVGTLLAKCHQIKGGAASIGLHRAAKLSHLMEDLLQEAEEAGGTITPEFIDPLVSAVDGLRKFVERLKSGDPQSDGFEEAYRGLKTSRNAVAGPNPGAEEAGMGSTDRGEPDPPTEGCRLTEQEIELIRNAAPVRGHGLMGCATLEPGLPMSDVKAELLFNRLAQLGELFHRDPDEEAIHAVGVVQRVTFGVTTAANDETLRQELKLDGIAEVWTCPVSETPDGSGETPDGSVETPDGSDEVAASDHPGDTTEPSNATEPNATEPADTTEPASATEPSNATEPDDVCPSEDVPVATGGEEATGKMEPSRVADQKAATTDSSSGGRLEVAARVHAEKDKPAASRGKPVETLRVDIERLDQLMNLTGQLVINRARFGRLLDQFRMATSRKQATQRIVNMRGVMRRLLDETANPGHHGGSDRLAGCVESNVRQLMMELETIEQDVQQWSTMRSLVNDYSEAVHQMERISDGIQKCVMDTRMLPIGPLFSRFHRVVRDITRGNGKDVSLVVRGEKTELDKRMIDELGDPLIHMVRNAADHGIETPEERQAAGKPAQGTVTLEAMHRGNRIIIRVCDDGRGLDPVKLRAKAVERGIISRLDADRMSDKQSFQLIWEPGFSTAEAVTEISGRGMGMDIVRSKIEHLSGTIELESQPDIGTTITIKLPLTMAILPSLLTTILGDVFAIPVESVIEIVRVPVEDLQPVHGLMTACVRDRILSVVALPELLRWKGAPGGAPSREEITLVIVGSDGAEIGIVVDRLLGEEDIVIKSLAENYRSVNGLAGASILGDGKVALILDVAGILMLAGQRARSVVSKRSRGERVDVPPIPVGSAAAGTGGFDV